MDRVDCIVAGAGVVGLAMARELARAGRETVVLEADTAIGTGVSSRNSEVVHAGIYYPLQSLKARLCVQGKELLYRYCAERGIPMRRCGKLVVATRRQDEGRLAQIAEHAAACGVELHRLTRAQARQLEPALECTAALHSPSSGIVDSHALMLALQGDAEAHGAAVALASPSRAHCARTAHGSCAPSATSRSSSPRSGSSIAPVSMHSAWRDQCRDFRRRRSRRAGLPRATTSRFRGARRFRI
jgi:L-2-hydroxyglutarate oxidase LhgO